MTDWAAIIAADFAVPAGRALPDLAGELLDALCSPDPALRDAQAYPILTAWILARHLDSQLTELGERVVRLLAHPQTQARTFAALIVAALIHRDTAAPVLDTPTLLRWANGVADWWVAETDLRGWDDQLGWLHAAAHGADVIGELGLSPGSTAMTWHGCWRWPARGCWPPPAMCSPTKKTTGSRWPWPPCWPAPSYRWRRLPDGLAPCAAASKTGARARFPHPWLIPCARCAAST
jgi:hypothetical protein